MKYSTMGLQMVGAILIMAWLGSFLDDYFHTKKGYLTLICMLFGVMASIILLVRGIKKNQKDNEE